MTPTDLSGVELRAGDLRLAVRPDLGGAIAGLWHRGTPVLRSTEPAALAASRPSACYPLVPYSNRIGHRHFDWAGQSYTTAQNFDDNPHSVHGVAWQRPWAVESRDAAALVIRHRHTPDEHWPFAFEVAQHFMLGADTLTVRLVFTNTDERSQPVGLGWHPYFPRRERSHLDIGLTGRWDADAVGLPVRRMPQPGIHGAVAQFEFDNCFDGWTGTARIDDEHFSVQLSSTTPCLVVYTPQDKPYFCVEPVSHVSNAIQMEDPIAHGLRDVPPGGVLEASMRLEVVVS